MSNMTQASSGIIKISDIDFSSMNWIKSLCEGREKRILPGNCLEQAMIDFFTSGDRMQQISGVLYADDRYLLLVWKGFILQAIDLKDGLTGETVYQKAATEKRDLTFFQFETQMSGIILIISTVFDRGRPFYRDISIEDMDDLIADLVDFEMTGIVHFQSDKGDAYFGYEAGQKKLILISSRFEPDLEVDDDTGLSENLAGYAVKASLYRSLFKPLHESYRRFFKGTRMLADLKSEGSGHAKMILDPEPNDIRTSDELRKTLKLIPETGNRPDIHLGADVIPNEDFFKTGLDYQVVDWFVYDYFFQMLSSGYRDMIKPAVARIPEIHTIKFRYPVEDETGQTHVFDIVTLNSHGRMLHVIHLGKDGDAETISNFFHSICSIKKKIAKNQVDTVIYISEHTFTDRALQYYDNKTGKNGIDHHPGNKGFAAMQDSQGFYFHLVHKSASGFNLIKPDLETK